MGAKREAHVDWFYGDEKARNKEQEAEILQWIEDVLGEKLPSGQYEDILKDGVVLCNLINKIAPGSVKKIQTKGTNFQSHGEHSEVSEEDPDQLPAHGEHSEVSEEDPDQLPAHGEHSELCRGVVVRFQAAIKKYGVPEEEIFQTADLFERRNIVQVTLCIYSLGRITQKHPEYTGPPLGPKMADECKRTFTEEQLRASEGHLNLQMGYNKGASQSGQGSFGNTRHM
uniref:Calponin n=1 Tax=Timema monikensis TaxID=170555 RepID=A0A7R9HVT0_9NEOP|nr:unnamed protein product [Timema monikensis]